MNELIKLKKHKYNKIPDNYLKNDLVISEIMYEMIDNIVLNIDDKECRICFEEETVDNPFISPCRCSGTSKYVHKKCLEQWRYQSENRDCYEMCMECRYHYKFLNEYPYEFNSRIPHNFFIIFCTTHIIPTILSIPISEINRVNDNVIIDFYSGGNSSVNYFMSVSKIYKDTLNYDICYNIILFHQTLFFLFCYFIFIYSNIHRRSVYFYYIKGLIPFQLLYAFKFLIIININSNDMIWVNFLLILTFLIGTFEPIFYSIIINKHNQILYLMDLDNKLVIQNYSPEDDELITRSLSEIL